MHEDVLKVGEVRLVNESIQTRELVGQISKLLNVAVRNYRQIDDMSKHISRFLTENASDDAGGAGIKALADRLNTFFPDLPIPSDRMRTLMDDKKTKYTAQEASEVRDFHAQLKAYCDYAKRLNNQDTGLNYVLARMYGAKTDAGQ